jgi:hypothetical protein
VAIKKNNLQISKLNREKIDLFSLFLKRNKGDNV